MPPLKQPLSLQKLSLESASNIIICYALYIDNQPYIFRTKWKKDISCLLKKFVPNKLFSDIFHSALKKLADHMSDCKSSNAIGAVAFLVKMLIHPTIKDLSFSALLDADEVEFELLDRFENVLSSCLPYMPSLTHLDLSTDIVATTLPSCSNNVLYIIGHHCPSLRILDLNYNNRVSRDGLRCLAPAKYNRGCPYLEEIYVKGCSIDHSDILWLIKKFKNLYHVQYKDMGSVLRDFMYSLRKLKFKFNLTYFDNSESKYLESDGDLIRMISTMCPRVSHLKVRIHDDDCKELYNLRYVTSLELRFYTRIYHAIGTETIAYLKAGSHLSSLTIYCDALNSYHVGVIASKCFNLEKLIFSSKSFKEVDRSFSTVRNNMSCLKVLSIKIGKHEMDDSPSADSIVSYLVSSCVTLQEIYLFIRCININFNLLSNCMMKNPLEHLKLFICDAPSCNLDVPVINLGYRSLLLLIERCPQLSMLGNVEAWPLSSSEVEELDAVVRFRNLDINFVDYVSDEIQRMCRC